jgi:IS5 family transposase
LHGKEEVVYGDAGYQCIAKRHQLAGHETTFRMSLDTGKRRAMPDTPEGRWRIWSKPPRPTSAQKWSTHSG